MPNKNYLRGVRFERELVTKYKPEKGFSLRSAGSHSDYDVIILDQSKRTVLCVQCKTKLVDVTRKDKTEQLHESGIYTVKFLKWTKYITRKKRK